MEATSLMNAGDARRVILETILDLRSGNMSAATGMAIAANMKVLNDSIQTEINYTKTAMLAQERGHDFGRIVPMGQRLIASAA
jgi:hypothetical protein